MPEEWLASVLVALAGVFSDWRGEDSLASASDRSSGICTLSCGRLAPLWLSPRVGGGGKSVDEAVRFGMGVLS